MARSWSSLPWKRSGADEFKSLQIVLQNFRITSLFVMETDIRDDLETKIIGSIFFESKSVYVITRKLFWWRYVNLRTCHQVNSALWRH